MCRYKSAKCYKCGKIGHLQSECKNKTEKPQKRRIHHTEVDSDVELFHLHSMGKEKSTQPIWISPKLNGTTVKMELDTGAAVSVMSKSDKDRLLPGLQLSDTSVMLRTYTGEAVKPVGVATVQVTYDTQDVKLPLYIIDKEGPPLFGRTWLRNIHLNWKEIHSVRNATLDDVIRRHGNIFKPNSTGMKDIKARLVLEEGATHPDSSNQDKCHSIQEKVAQELDRLEREGVISPVKQSDWASPIVPVRKSNGDIRICGDFKVTVNQVLKRDQHPSPKSGRAVLQADRSREVQQN